MYRHCICIGVLIFLNLPLWSQQDTGDSVPSPGEIFQDCDECPKMVVIPSGSFQMGCVLGKDCEDSEKPMHSVRIDSFAMSKYEVTFEEYDVFTDATGRERVDDRSWGRGRRPVIRISWYDAVAYAAWLSSRTGKTYRLLSESEWEYVARAGKETAYSWGDSIGVNRANCDGCRSQWDAKMTAPVRSFAANAWGVHDMHGNVEEWVQGCWYENYKGAPTDGSAWEPEKGCLKVMRGGSWGNGPSSLRSASRDWSVSSYRNNNGGFRVARDL